MRVEEVVKKWSGFDLPTFNKIISTKEPLVTMATLSLYRYELLFKQLENTRTAIKTPLYICLRVQAAEAMPQAFKIKLIQVLEKNYKGYDLQFTYKNHGSGVPRNDVVTRARKHFGTPYIMTLDDDIILPPFAVEALVSILMKRPELGAVALSCHPRAMTVKLEGGHLIDRRVAGPFGAVDGAGSATMVIRRKVFETCDLDRNYYIGWGDLDFCMQMRRAGWKVGYLNLKDYQAANPQQRNQAYMKIRFSREHANRSWDRFYKKWGIKIGR